MEATQNLYEEHHLQSRAPGFSILKEDRGAFFASEVGTNKEVLDLGCRDGALTQYFLTGNRVQGVDVDEKALARARELGVSTKFMDLMGDWHEVQDERYDVITAGELLEHLFYPEEIVKKVKNALRPRGKFIGSVPNAFSLKNRVRYLRGTTKYTPLSDPTHINQFSAESLKELLLTQFDSVQIIGLGKYKKLASISPNWFAFDLGFVAS